MTTHADQIDVAKFRLVGVFALSEEDLGIADDEVLVQSEALSAAQVQEIIERVHTDRRRPGSRSPARG